MQVRNFQNGVVEKIRTDNEDLESLKGVSPEVELSFSDSPKVPVTCTAPVPTDIDGNDYEVIRVRPREKHVLDKITGLFLLQAIYVFF